MTLNIAFWANSAPRVSSYIYLARECSLRGYKVALFYPRGRRPEPEEVEGFDTVDLVESHRPAEQFQNFDILMTSEVMGDQLPRNTMNVALMHSLPDRGSLQIDYSTHLGIKPMICSFDYFVLAGRQSQGAWQESRYQRWLVAESASRKRSCFDVVGGGYPKLDYLTAMLTKQSCKDCIIFSPTKSSNPAGIVEEHGVDIISALHDRFSDYEIVFRPYPTDDERVISAVSEACSHLPRFALDRTVTGLGSQKRAALVVTDRSSNAVTFSLASRKPSVFASMGETDYGGNALEMLGYEAIGLEAILASAERALSDDQEIWKDRIDRARTSLLYHPFDANEYLSSRMEVFASGGSDPDWLSVPRPGQ